MADLLGGSPNLLDDVFRDLEDWEALLKSIPELDVDDLPEAPPPPDLTPYI